ncbi:MAG: carbohydrate ABC transporter permease [Candidatus Enteromonas sp.]
MKQAYITTALRLVPPSYKTKKKKENTSENLARIEKNQKIKKIVGLVFVYAFLTFFALIVLFPFYYMIVASFMTQQEAYQGALFPELSSVFENIAYNYSNTFERLDFMSHVGTTLIVAVATTILQLLTTILAAYAFARLEFRGRDVLFIFFLTTMMVPGELLAIANYTTMANLGFINKNQTYGEALFVMIVPLIASSFYIYLLRQNFKQIPNELYLASKVDGKSDWAFLWKVMAPLSSPTLITIAILSFISSWNSYVWPNRSVTKPEFQVISVIIRTGSLTVQDEMGNWVTMLPWQMTASVLTVVPLLLLFIIFRKYIMSGTGRSGIKG